MKVNWILLVLALVFSACDRQAEQSTSKGAANIEWFDGDVDAAFAAAKDSGKPVYLYWGAEWCPPCHAIDATVFRSPEFIERSRLFVPVYLDGDTENAQAAGERFGVLGYPTMIIFDSNGQELSRIPGGIDMQAYANVLDLTLSNSSSTVKLVDRVLNANASLSEGECKQLAYYSWGQDAEILLDHEEHLAFRRMYNACPDSSPAERSVLYFNWLDAKLDSLDTPIADAGPGALTVDEKREATVVINKVLDDSALTRTNVFPVIFEGARFTAALTASDTKERETLTKRFHAAYDQLFKDETLYKRERLYTLAGKIGFERMDDEDAELSDELIAEITQAVVWADDSTPNKYERQPIINALSNILEAAGMNDLARDLLTAELQISDQAYYFMVDLAHVEQRAGNFEIAIDWLKKAWDASTGPATRFQWGNYYLTGLLEMTPDDSQRIHETTVQLIAEMQSGSGFYQRPRSQLLRLESRLRKWSEKHGTADELQAIRQSVVTVCAKDLNAESQERCNTFLETV